MDTSHWADRTAEKIIREKGDKETYTLASGITPSGTVHIGNFREIISTELVARALKDKGKKVRFIYSWDDYDVFRKVPKNMPQQELLEKHLRFPITLVPDTTGSGEASYARKNEVDIEKILPEVGIYPQYIYQAERYRSSYYAEDIKFALEHKKEIMAVLNQYRSEPLDDSWWPIAVFSGFTNKDTTTILSWDGKWGITYRDDECKKEETIDLRKTSLVKLHWRIDWPMRWAKEGVDFEPAGKDHHSQGGSFDTSKQIVEIFGKHAPVSFQYDFLSIKGRGGKISSSSGEVISLKDVLEVYTPEVCRYLFSSTRVNAEFAISFDADVIKIYEDYDRCERVAFGIDEANEEKREKQKRIWELSQVDSKNMSMSYQVPFRQLCTALQINSFDEEAVFALYKKDVKKNQVDRFKKRISCASVWIQNFAPDEFKWRLQTKKDKAPSFNSKEKEIVKGLKFLSSTLNKMTSQEVSTQIYDLAQKNEVSPQEVFTVAYKALIGKEKGPRLADFLKNVGEERALEAFGRIK